MQIRWRILDTAQGKGLDRTICTCHPPVDHTRLKEALYFEVMHQIIRIVRSRMANCTLSFTEEDCLSPHFRLCSLLGTQFAIKVQLGSRREIKNLLKFRHKVDLTGPFQNVDTLLGCDNRISIKIGSPLLKLSKILYAFQCSL